MAACLSGRIAVRLDRRRNGRPNRFPAQEGLRRHLTGAAQVTVIRRGLAHAGGLTGGLRWVGVDERGHPAIRGEGKQSPRRGDRRHDSRDGAYLWQTLSMAMQDFPQGLPLVQ